MITFFRKIRQRFLTENRFSKYMIYAFGEIILVVIGILIALQINNWNEYKKTKKKETKLLLELGHDLKETKIDLLSDIKKAQNILSTTNEIYKAAINGRISQTNPFELSMDYVFEFAKLFPKLSAYQAIQTEGVSIISNDILRKMVTDFYQLNLKRVAGAESYLDNLNVKEFKPYLNTFSNYGSTCNDCEDLYDLFITPIGKQQNIYFLPKVDDKLVHLLKEKFHVNKTLNERYLELSRIIDEIIILIEQETETKL